MNPQAFEVVVREIAYYAVLLSGTVFLAGVFFALAAWMLRILMRTLGLYIEFLSFVRNRRRRR